MKKIQVLGTGCAKCEQLAENAAAAADKLGIGYELEKVTDMGRIVASGVLMTPALAVDGKVVSSGTVPTVMEIVDLIQREAPADEKKCGCCCDDSC